MSSCNGNCSSCGSDCGDRKAESLLAQPDIDGGLIGGASLDPEKFVRIINASNQETE